MEAPTTRSELEGNVAEVRAKVSCPPQSQLHVSMEMVALKYQSLPQNLSPPKVEHSPPPPPPHVYSIGKSGCIFHFDLSLFYFIAIIIQHFYNPTLSHTNIIK